MLNYMGSTKYQEANCINGKSNLVKIKEFLDASIPSSSDFDCSSSWFHYYATLYGSSVSAAAVFIKIDKQLYPLKYSDENGKIYFNTRLSLKDSDSLIIMANGYETTSIPITGVMNHVPLFSTNSSKIVNPSFRILNVNPISAQSSLQVKVGGKNILTYEINQHNSDSIFMPLKVLNGIATINLDTGFNKVIIRYIGMDTAYQQKGIYYLPDTLLSTLTFNLAIQAGNLIGARVYINNEYYSTLTSSISNFKLINGINEIKVSKFGYRDSLFTAKSDTSISLSMQLNSYSSITDSSIYNFNNNLNSNKNGNYN